MQKFEVMPDKYSVVGIYIGWNYEMEYITKIRK